MKAIFPLSQTINMQPSNFIISNLTINVRDCESCAPFIKKQKSSFRQSQKKQRKRSVEMYDEDVYAPELEEISWDTLVRNTAEFHCVFAPQKISETFDEYMVNNYTEVEEEKAMDVRLANNPYHQEMLDEYAAIVAKVCADIAKEHANEKKEYTCCTGCRSSNGTRPFHFCKRSYAANYTSDTDSEDEDDNYDDNDDNDDNYYEDEV